MALVLAQSIRYRDPRGAEGRAGAPDHRRPDRAPRDSPRGRGGRGGARPARCDLARRRRLRRLPRGRVDPHDRRRGRAAGRGAALLDAGRGGQRAEPAPVPVLDHGRGADADPGLDGRPAAAAGFLVGFYACLVGAKMLLAVVAGRSGGGSPAAPTAAVMVVLGGLLLLFAVRLAIEGLRLLGCDGSERAPSRTVGGPTDRSAPQALPDRADAEEARPDGQRLAPGPAEAPGSSGPAARGEPSAGAIRMSGTKRDAFEDPLVGGGRREAADHRPRQRHGAAEGRDDPGPGARVACLGRERRDRRAAGEKELTRGSSRTLRYQRSRGRTRPSPRQPRPSRDSPAAYGAGGRSGGRWS